MCPECTAGHLVPCVEGRCRVGTINSGGHSTANPLENRYYAFQKFQVSRSRYRALVKYRANQSVFENSAPAIYRPAYFMSNFDSTSRIIQRPEIVVLLIVYSITRRTCLIRPYDVCKKRWLDLKPVHHEIAPIIASLSIPCH
ncbi:hypothetical protein AVEN_20100-1 [Araneus ventricosus]|uniref:Uncharacterized protein n=1 Tax=Araneus ventricosus TaxID=182803 RepID=A0A4Y2M356_ARAVE|nr:hypothetical protein AVEN_20100-1 [Araneus ventricosus]